MTLIALVAASSAQAFVGESLVIDPATGQLTKAAEAWIKNGGNLKELILRAGGSGLSEETAAAGVFADAGVLPVLGPAVLAFGAGVGIGTEICNILGLSGCLFESSTGANPEGNWTFKEEGCKGPPAGPKWSYYATSSGNACEVQWFNEFGNHESCGNKPPSGKDGGAATVTGLKCATGPEAGTYTYGRGYLFRYGLDNRTFDWHASDNPEIGNYTWGGSGSKALEKLAEKLKGKADSTTEGKVGSHVASEVDPEGKVKDPYATYVTVPSCSGEAWIECKADLNKLKLVPERNTLDWKHALIELKPGAVTTLSPAAGSEVKTETKVVVTTNPDEAGMPIVIPQPESHETYSHYAARLNPSLVAVRHDREAAFVVPSLGPDEIIKVQPDPETRFEPGTKPEVKVETNPPDAPIVGAPWSPPGIPSIDTGPIEGIPSPCGMFPFGLFCWIGEAFAQFNTTGKCPGAKVNVDYEAHGEGEGVTVPFGLSLCGSTSELVMGYVRPAILLVFIVGLGIMFAKGTKAIGGDD